jgi:large subunit ribosomal protein L14
MGVKKRIRAVRVVGDNSGVRAMRSFGGPRGIGSILRGSVTKYRKGTKWQKGIVVKGVVVSVAKERGRSGGQWVRLGVNGIVLLNANNDPVGQRSRAVVGVERREKGFGKVASRAAYVV